jgi:hypothetical protein
MARASDGTVYTLADANYVPGLVALVNSLALQGHELQVVALDGGVPADARARFGDRVEFISLPADLAGRGYLAKSFLSTLDVRGTVLWIDSDIILTSPLDDVLEHARSGRFCAFRDDFPPGYERHFPEWEQLFGLATAPRPQTYVSAGFFAFSADRWPALIQRWSEATHRVSSDQMFTGDHLANPLWAGDQDALNALLMSELPADALVAFPSVEMAHTRTIDEARVVDARALLVVHRGSTARMVHYSWGPKPWMAADWRRIGTNAYVTLLQRLLFDDDVEVAWPPQRVPVWLRRGVRGRATLRAIAVARGVRSGLGTFVRRLPSGLSRPLVAVRDRIDEGLSRR